MKQKFIVQLTFRDDKVMWLAGEKCLTDDITKAYPFALVPYWRKTYKRFKPKSVAFIEAE